MCIRVAPSRVRELKLWDKKQSPFQFPVAPSRVRELKQIPG